MGIAGSPGGVEAAAGAIEGAGRDFADAADSIASHGRAVTADWTGSASEAAGASIAALADRTRVGADVCAGVGPVLRAYAVELRAAQGQYDDGSATADAGIIAQRSATAAAHSAGALARDDPGRAGTQAAAARAGDRADAQVRSGQALMIAAVGRAERANAAAAAAIDALTDQLADMTPTGSAASTGGDWGDANPPSSSDAGKHHHGWLYDAVGGLGNAAWAAGPGLVGDVAGWSPFASDKAVGRRIEGAHDWLVGWYGADTGSTAYRGSDGVGQVATFFMPGEGWVKGAEAASKADEALRLGDAAAARIGGLEEGSAASQSTDGVVDVARARADAALAYATRPERLKHTFEPKHNFDPLVEKHGSQQAVVAEILKAIQDEVPTSGRFVLTRNISGQPVVVRGAVVDGVVKIGTAFTP